MRDHKNELKILEYLKNKKLTSINALRILDKIINPYQRSFSAPDIIRSLREITCENRINEALGYLVDAGILKDSKKRRGRPPKYVQDGYESKSDDPSGRFQFVSNPPVFKKIFYIYFYNKPEEFSIARLLKSDYTDDFVKNYGLSEVHKAIKPFLEESNFRQLSTESMFNLDSTKREYLGYAKQLRKLIIDISKIDVSESKDHRMQEEIEVSDFVRDLGKEMSPKSIEPISILRDFEPMQTVQFYRETLHNEIVEAYNELAKGHIITKGLRNFLALDNYLSPLTSHPANNVLKVLFYHPFERIYSDAYLLNGEAFDLLSRRAAAIYDDFSDILFEYFRYDPSNREDRIAITRNMIYNWNVASTRFDLICQLLGDVFEKGSKNYHLQSDGLELNVIDLMENKSLLDPESSSAALMVGLMPFSINWPYSNADRGYPELMADPYDSLRPCLTFQNFGWRYEYIPFDEIFKELERKLDENNLIN